jgi:LAO/AO transport system kinase
VQDKITQLLKDIKKGDFHALARGITIIENEVPGYEELLKQLEHNDSVKVIGITGPPGAGKSTLVNSLLRYWVGKGKSVAVLAVDPSSPFNYGALLGDRIRMSEFYNQPGVYIRSMASRGALGGLNSKILQITDAVKNATFDFVIVETVGVGQSEVEIAGLADCTVVVLVPEAGDEVQTLKAGLMEIADIFVVNKADRDQAETLSKTLKIMVHERADPSQSDVPVVKTVATDSAGITDLAKAIDDFMVHIAGKENHKIDFLVEKAWQLIQKERMKGIGKQQLRAEIEKELNKGAFNLYSFAKLYISK